MPNKPPRYKPPRAAQVTAPPTQRATAAERGYGSRWQRYRLAFLAEHPLCVECEKENRTTEATVVDHIVPHKGDEDKFWRATNHQGLCTRHHNLKTQREGAFGRPMKENHHVEPEGQRHEVEGRARPDGEGA